MVLRRCFRTACRRDHGSTQFYNYIEEDELVKTNSKLAKATLIKEYKGIRFYDAEEGDKGEHYRIRSDRFDWTAGRGWGWSVSCDKMPNENAETDPSGDLEITSSYEPCSYVINGTLHEMIGCAKQAPGVVLEDPDEEED